MFGHEALRAIMAPKERRKIERQDKQEYKQFLVKSRRLFRKYLPIVARSEPLLIASEYYLHAVTSGNLDYSLILNAMICLEALFTDGHDDISRKIRTRAGAIIALGGKDRDEATKQIRRFYDIRSTIVHGRKKRATPTDDAGEIMEMLPKIKECATICLKHFLILAKNRMEERDARRAVNADLDRSLLDDKLRLVLEKEIRAGNKEFDAVKLLQLRGKPVIDWGS
jgi:hypothetical protein